MPELPEVETTRRGLLPHIKDKMIKNVIVRQPRLRWPIPKNIIKNISGKVIEDIERRAKYLLFKIDQGTLIIHLGMSGHLRVLSQQESPNKHDHFDIIFQDNTVLRYHDPRRFGAILWTEGYNTDHPLLKNLGVEPLTQAFTGHYLLSQAKNKKLPIKSFIMDNKIVTGVGNIYATEALFESNIHPTTQTQSISLAQFQLLAKVIKHILRQAIQRGGTTLKDFLDSNGKPGYFSNQLKVYGRAGLPCIKCHTLLQTMRIGQRSTVFCSQCQQ